MYLKSVYLFSFQLLAFNLQINAENTEFLWKVEILVVW